MLLWIDIETTGLDASTHKVLEVAAIATADDLTEVARFQAVTDEASKIALKDAPAGAMHVKSGLWLESACFEPNPTDQGKKDVRRVDRALAAFISDNCGAEPVQLAGSTVGFDRKFLERHFPRTTELLHYRSIDVTTLHELARRLWPEIHCRPEGEPAHRAMADVESSLECARKYAMAIGAWRAIATTPIAVQVPDPIPADLQAKLEHMETYRTLNPIQIMSSRVNEQDLTQHVLKCEPTGPAFHGLRALVNLPATQLSKALRTEDVAAALAWIRTYVENDSLTSVKSLSEVYVEAANEVLP